MTPHLHIDRDPAEPGVMVDVAFRVKDWFEDHHAPAQHATGVTVRHYAQQPEGEFVATIARVRTRLFRRPAPMPDLDVVVIVAPNDPFDPEDLQEPATIDPATGVVRWNR